LCVPEKRKKEGVGIYWILYIQISSTRYLISYLISTNWRHQTRHHVNPGENTSNSRKILIQWTDMKVIFEDGKRPISVRIHSLSVFSFKKGLLNPYLFLYVLLAPRMVTSMTPWRWWRVQSVQATPPWSIAAANATDVLTHWALQRTANNRSTPVIAWRFRRCTHHLIYALK
jgi:hypothetical protein